MGINLVLAGAKLAAGFVGHSHALTADGIESVADFFSSLVVWRGLVVAAEPADEDHPYGHGKAEPIAAAIVSSLLLVAAAWICASALVEVLHPHTAPAPFTLLVLGATVVIKEGLFRFIRRESVSVGSSAMHTDAWHHRGDALTSLAAAVGISISLIGGKGYEAADDIAAVAAAGIIAWNGARLLRDALQELMDRSPAIVVVAQIRQAAAETSGVDCIEKCLVRKMGYYLYVDMHVQVDPRMTVLRSHQIAHEVKDKVRRQFPAVKDVLVHIEPANHSTDNDGR
jgi:cation diffusion facilitator family transporter